MQRSHHLSEMGNKVINHFYPRRGYTKLPSAPWDLREKATAPTELKLSGLAYDLRPVGPYPDRAHTS